MSPAAAQKSCHMADIVGYFEGIAFVLDRTG